MQFEAIKSSIIAFRRHDASTCIMTIVFRDRRTGEPTSVYEYGNVDAKKFDEGCAAESFGSWFQTRIKPFEKNYPYRKLADKYNPADFSGGVTSLFESETTDFASQQPLPVKSEPVIVVPEDEEGLETATNDLVTNALALLPGQTKEAIIAGSVVINIQTPAQREQVDTMTLAFTAMRKGIAGVYDPKIKERHDAHKAAIAQKRVLDRPLEILENLFRQGIGDYDLAQEHARRAEEIRLRDIQVKQAEEEAAQRAEELKLQDAIAAEQKGETQLAEKIISSPALPVTPAYTAPVHVPSAVPINSAFKTRIVCDWELVDINKVPQGFTKLIADEATISARVASLGLQAFNAEEHGIRVFEAPATRRSGKAGRI